MMLMFFVFLPVSNNIRPVSFLVGISKSIFFSHAEYVYILTIFFSYPSLFPEAASRITQIIGRTSTFIPIFITYNNNGRF